MKTNYHIISSMWMLSGASGFVACSIEIIRSLGEEATMMNGGFLSVLIGLAFCSLVILTAFGLFRARRWARVAGRAIAVLLALYTLSFITLVGMSFGLFAFIASLLGFAFSAYAFVVASGKYEATNKPNKTVEAAPLRSVPHL